MAQKGETIIRFESVSFEYGHNKPILDEVSFPVRLGSKLTLMGQNGAGKSTIFGMITGELKPENGDIHISRGVSIAVSRQIIPRQEQRRVLLDCFLGRGTAHPPLLSPMCPRRVCFPRGA